MPYSRGGDKCNKLLGYTFGEDNQVSYGRKTWLAQTFTVPVLTVVWRCRFKSWTSDPGEFYEYAIKSTDGTGAPAGPDLSHTSLSPTGEEIYSPGKWRRFDFDDFPNLPPGTYALIASVPTSPSSTRHKLRADVTASIYPYGKAWVSTDSGATWTQIPNTNLIFEAWGWLPPPYSDPPPAIINWAPLSITDHWRETGLEIVVTTNTPCHLYLRWTDKEPKKQRVTTYRRGLLIPMAIRFCFIGWHENEQIEDGDTYKHTFHKENWPICQTRWFYFIGERHAEESPSTSPIFWAHRGEKPTGWEMNTFNTIEPNFRRASASNAWSVLDLSYELHPEATGAIIHVLNTNAGEERRFGLRPLGSAYDVHRDLRRKTHTWALCGVDANRKLEVFAENLAQIDLWIMGYTGRNVWFFENPIDILPPFANVWTDVSTQLFAPGAIGVILNVGREFGGIPLTAVRMKGSTDERYYSTWQSWPVVGLDSNGLFQIKMNDINPVVSSASVVGFFTTDAEFAVNGIDISPFVNGVWQPRSIDQFATPPRWGIIEVHPTFAQLEYGAQKNHSRRNLLWDGYQHDWAFIHADFSYNVELYGEDPGVDFHLIGVTR